MLKIDQINQLYSKKTLVEQKQKTARKGKKQIKMASAQGAMALKKHRESMRGGNSVNNQKQRLQKFEKFKPLEKEMPWLDRIKEQDEKQKEAQRPKSKSK